MIIKCACDRDDCESTLELFNNGTIFIVEKAGIYNTSASFQLPLHIAKAIARAMEQPHSHSEEGLK